jgi:uncharacterized protein
MAERVDCTSEAAAMIDTLVQQHGAVLFHQSGGCCDGSSPMCYQRGEFKIGGRDVLLGIIHGETPVYIGSAQFEYWQHTRLTIDVVPGRGAGFSLEAPEGVRFLTRSRLFTDQESVEIVLAGPPLRGPEAAGLA